MIYNVHPLLVSVVAYFILKEKITKLKIIALIGAFSGVLLITLHKNESHGVEDNYLLGIGLASVSFIAGTTVAILLRIVNQHIHYTLSPFWFGTVTFIESILMLILLPSVYNFEHYTSYGMILFSVSGMFNYIGQVFKSLSYKFGEASVVTPAYYLEVCYIFMSDLLIFKYSFNFTDLTGAILITI